MAAGNNVNKSILHLIFYFTIKKMHSLWLLLFINFQLCYQLLVCVDE